MSNILLLIVIIAGGVAAAIQPVINARLAIRTGVLESATVSFAVGTLVLLVLSLTVSKGSFRGIVGAQPWEISGGLYGAFFVSLMILAVPRLGVTTVMAALIVAQLVTGLVFDHYGLMGVRMAPIDLKRIIGVVLLLLGTVLIYRR
ncbi:MAG TPA: DMT family transporter [Geopsychrobacteraceae bacterium]|nr:DMT family transporter [Geopsychrobacteraceae bacterium]